MIKSLLGIMSYPDILWSAARRGGGRSLGCRWPRNRDGVQQWNVMGHGHFFNGKPGSIEKVSCFQMYWEYWWCCHSKFWFPIAMLLFTQPSFGNMYLKISHGHMVVTIRHTDVAWDIHLDWRILHWEPGEFYVILHVILHVILTNPICECHADSFLFSDLSWTCDTSICPKALGKSASVPPVQRSQQPCANSSAQYQKPYVILEIYSSSSTINHQPSIIIIIIIINHQ